MILGRNKLYFIIFIACIAGYIWLFYNLLYSTQDNQLTVCLIKNITNIPCPSCGTTRSVISLANGNFMKALMINPIGLLAAITLLLLPLWVITDIVTQQQTLLHTYQKAESLLKKRQYAIPLILFVIINWIWNIIKGL